MPLTYFAPTLDLMIKIARSYDVDPLPLMRKLAINPALVADPNARFRINQVEPFFTQIAELIPDPNSGLKSAQLWHPTQMGALGYAWMTSETLRTAFSRLARFIEILNEATNIKLKESSDSLSLVLQLSSAASTTAFRIDAPMAILLAMARGNAGEDFHPQSVTFAHPEPEDTGAFYSLFQCPITFDADVNSFTISAAEADKPRSCSNTQLALLHDQLLIKYVAKLSQDNIIERTKIAIIAELATGNISDSAVAETLFLTERTLQRRLREYDTTFKTLLSEVRMDLADSYIRNSRLSLGEISFMLGFSEMSSFSHAFKRWTGQSPSHYRQSSLD